MADPQLRASTWNNVRLALFDGAVTPEAVADLLVAAPPVEDTSDGIRGLLTWTFSTALPLAPEGTTERYHAAVVETLARVTPGSEIQLSAFRAALLSAGSPERLVRWAAGEDLPEGIVADTDLRWKAYRRLAEIGATDRATLDAALAAEPSTSASLSPSHGT